MEDADKNSKSLVLITRVGSTPTTGTKQAVRTFSGSGLLYFCCKSHLCVLREDPDDGIGRRYLTGEIQMCINAACCVDVTVTQLLSICSQAGIRGSVRQLDFVFVLSRAISVTVPLTFAVTTVC